jgi:uncharacterized protein YegP (UPF0339 family)
MSEFSRRVNVQVFKDEPKSLEEFFADWPAEEGDGVEVLQLRNAVYRQYLDRFQPYRWSAVAGNNEPVAHGESYFNEVDCINAIELLAADDTTMYWAREYGEDRGYTLLRYGVTDRNSQAGGAVPQ